VFRIAQWPENLKAVRAGHYSLWHLGFGALGPDSDSVLALAYGGGGTLKRAARFDLPAFDAQYLAQRRLPDGPERAAAMARAAALMVAYMPYKLSNWRIETDLMQPWVVGYRRHPFTSFYRFVDIDIERQQAAHR
jgi:ABC-type transport system substrate-binding protein